MFRPIIYSSLLALLFTISNTPVCGQSNFSTSDGMPCTGLPKYQNEVSIQIQDSSRIIKSNSVPGHTIGVFPNNGNPNRLSPQNKTMEIPLYPEKANIPTSVYSGEDFGIGRPSYEFGVAVNGVMMEPSAMEAFENRETGELNFQWTKEALSTAVNLGDDCNNAHVQPNGKYHYHGTPKGLVSHIDGGKMFLTGWAADGFPIYYKYGYSQADNNLSEVIELKSSYQLKSGQRTGDGIHAPDGMYDGTYVRDFEYINGVGHLDQANGRFGVTPEFPDGTYYYVITDEFPSLPRYFVGTPSQDFKIGGGNHSKRFMSKRQQSNGYRHPDQSTQGAKNTPQHPVGQRGNQRPSVNELFRNMDRNKDNKLSKGEVRGPLSKDFDRVDKNSDGFLSRDEIKKSNPPRRGN